jgi:hypothetical protein
MAIILTGMLAMSAAAVRESSSRYSTASSAPAASGALRACVSAAARLWRWPSKLLADNRRDDDAKPSGARATLTAGGGLKEVDIAPFNFFIFSVRPYSVDIAPPCLRKSLVAPRFESGSEAIFTE